jgi:nucleotide-binding universal stress UspA family protein
MFQTILIPLDGSDRSERALPYARRLADASGARLVLLRVVPPTLFPDRPDPEAEAKALSDASAYVDAFVPRAEGDPSVEAIAYVGDAVAAIIDEAHARPATLIVMSTHGRSGVSRLAHGSVASEVIRRAQVPVLVVPRHCNRAWSTPAPARLLITVDGSELSHAILPPALDLARLLNADITLLRAVSPVKYIRVEGYEDPVAVPVEGIGEGEAEDYVNTLATGLRPKHGRIAVRVVEGQNAASAIAYAAQDEAVDAVALATHGRTGLARLVLGSVAVAVVQDATVPVLLMRPAALHSAASATT